MSPVNDHREATLAQLNSEIIEKLRLTVNIRIMHSDMVPDENPLRYKELTEALKEKMLCTGKISKEIRPEELIPSDWDKLLFFLNGETINRLMPYLLFMFLINYDDEYTKALDKLLRKKVYDSTSERLIKFIAGYFAAPTDNTVSVADKIFSFGVLPDRSKKLFWAAAQFFLLFRLPMCRKADRTMNTFVLEKYFPQIKYIFSADECRDFENKSDEIINDVIRSVSDINDYENYIHTFAEVYRKMLHSENDLLDRNYNVCREILSDHLSPGKCSLMVREQIFKCSYFLHNRLIPDIESFAGIIGENSAIKTDKLYLLAGEDDYLILIKTVLIFGLKENSLTDIYEFKWPDRVLLTEKDFIFKNYMAAFNNYNQTKEMLVSAKADMREAKSKLSKGLITKDEMNELLCSYKKICRSWRKSRSDYEYYGAMFAKAHIQGVVNGHRFS